MSMRPAALVDTHCHLNMKAFAPDLKQVIQRAQAAGVAYILVPGFDMESNRQALRLAKENPMIYAAIGVHPHHAADWSPPLEKELISLAKSPKVVAIGEIGLDFYRDLSPRDLQRKAFHSQLEIASRLNLPVLIHNRQATNDIIEIIRSWSNNAGGAQHWGVLHAYSGDLQSAKYAMDLGFFLGVAGSITFQNAKSAREMLAQLPLSHLMIETDAPYLTPHPYRGKRNEPGHVAIIARQLSQIFHCDYDQVAQQTTQNALRLFG